MTTSDFLTALPKVELHLHLEGAMSQTIMRTLAAKHGITDLTPPEHTPPADDGEGFARFLRTYRDAVRVLRDAEDFALLVTDVAANLARQNVRYAEINLSLSDHLRRGVPAEVVFDGVEHGRREAERHHGIVLRWIPDFAGDFGLDAAESTVDAVIAHGPASVLGLSIGGLEIDRGPFSGVFSRARAHGLRSLPHAGETEGPDRVWAAIHALGADRIGHGIGAATDPRLLAHLAEHQIPVDVCPTSNLCTGMVADLASHPLPVLLRAGVLVTVNTDDPALFGTDLVSEYRAVHAMGLGQHQLVHLARNGVRASFLDTAAKTALLAEIDQHTGSPAAER